VGKRGGRGTVDARLRPLPTLQAANLTKGGLFRFCRDRGEEENVSLRPFLLKEKKKAAETALPGRKEEGRKKPRKLEAAL